MTTSDRKSVTVDIYGTSYKLVGSSSDYTRQVANYVDDRMRTISKAHSRLDTPRIAVLAAVHMAEEALQKLEFQNEAKQMTAERNELRTELAKVQGLQIEQRGDIVSAWSDSRASWRSRQRWLRNTGSPRRI